MKCFFFFFKCKNKRFLLKNVHKKTWRSKNTKVNPRILSEKHLILDQQNWLNQKKKKLETQQNRGILHASIVRGKNIIS